MEYYTEDLGKFGYRERELLVSLLDEWNKNGLPDGFEYDNVRPAFNMNSGNVFLVNDSYQVAMMNEDTLEIWHSLPYSGEEGFLADLLELDPETLNADDIEYIQNLEPNYATERA